MTTRRRRRGAGADRRAPGRPDSRPRSSWPATASGRCSSSGAPRRRSCRARPWSAPARWSCCAPGDWRTRSAPAAIEVEWLMLQCETLAQAATGPRPGRHADAGSRAPWSARRARRACRRTTSRPCCCATCARRPARARRARHRGRRASTSGPDGVRAVLRDAPRRRRASSRARYLVAADGAHSTVRARARHPHARARPPRARSSRRCSAHRCGTCSASTGTASTASPTPRPPGLSSGRPGRPLALRHVLESRGRAGGRLRRGTAHRAHPARRRRPRPPAARSSGSGLLLRRADRRRLPRRRARSSSATPPTA